MKPVIPLKTAWMLDFVLFFFACWQGLRITSEVAAEKLDGEPVDAQ